MVELPFCVVGGPKGHKHIIWVGGPQGLKHTIYCVNHFLRENKLFYGCVQHGKIYYSIMEKIKKKKKKKDKSKKK